MSAPGRFPLVLRFAWAALATLSAGCASAGVAGSSASSDATGAAVGSERQVIVATHVSKCGACHVRPEPHTRTREQLEDAFARHRKRLRLTTAQWDAMIDYLAMAPGNTARETR